MITSAVLLAFAVCVPLFVWRSRRSSHDSDTTEPDNNFHAVSVRPGVICCASARRVNGTRFLSAEAPLLPLPGCDEESCACRFIHHQDRRNGDDRRLPFQATPAITGATGNLERRQRTDRREYRDDDELLFG